jgi:DNA primase
MARIPEAEIERLKREIALERLVEARGVPLKRKGADLVGRCPFGTHADSEPSFVVTPAKNLWHCFGCQQGGSVIDWMMKTEGVSFRHAVELLREDNASPATAAGMLPTGPHSRTTRAGLGVKRSRVQKLGTPLHREADDHELMLQVISYYHETLKESPAALSYLEKRGLRSEEAIERFKLGYANRTLGYRLPSKLNAAGRELRGRLQQLGIYRESGHEHFNGSLVIPIFDEHGQVAEIYGRKIVRGLHPSIALHLYLPGPHKGVWNIEALQASKEIILCEALIDALTFWCVGYRNVTASYGVEGFTEDHLAAFKRYGTERILIAYDRDEAGEKAAASLAEKLMAQGLECFRLHFPKGMDANEYALAVKPAEKSLGVLIRSAIWLGGSAVVPPARNAPARTDLSLSAASVGKAPAQAALASAGETAALPAAVAYSAGQAAKAEASPPSFSLAAEAAAETTNSGLLEPLASPLPPAPAMDVPLQINGDEIVMICGDRRYRVRGLAKNLSFDALKVNVMASREVGFHVDTIEMYAARQRQLFIRQAAEEMNVKEDVVKRDFGRLLLKLEELQDEAVRKSLEPKDETVTLTDEEQQAALELLRDPNLLQRILTDYERCGVVGEETNKLVCYLAAVSRKLDEPLAIIIQSSSAAGKSWLMNAVLQLMPEEEQVKYSAMTGQSLFYMSETNLRHKILAIVEEEGAERASYALKLLQSEGELTIASTGKDPTTGRLVTHEYRVEGPVMILLTTTAVEVDEELLNRCIVLTVDEDREQTRAIHRLQRERQTLEGMWARDERQALRKLHRDAQRLLRPLEVVNPFARELTFLDDQTRTRRDHMKYLALIQSIALLHQYQRPVKSDTRRGCTKQYVEVSLADIETANQLANEVLGRSLDELAPQTRRLLLLLDQMTTAACAQLALERSDYRFTQRDAREYTRWSDFQVKTHLRKLVELEYVIVHRGGRGQSFVYELLYDGQGESGARFLMKLIEVEKLRAKLNRPDYNAQREHEAVEWVHEKSRWEHSGSSEGAAWERPGSSAQICLKPNEDRTAKAIVGPTVENRIDPASAATAQSYVTAGRK